MMTQLLMPKANNRYSESTQDKSVSFAANTTLEGESLGNFEANLTNTESLSSQSRILNFTPGINRISSAILSNNNFMSPETIESSTNAIEAHSSDPIIQINDKYQEDGMLDGAEGLETSSILRYSKNTTEKSACNEPIDVVLQPKIANPSNIPLYSSLQTHAIFQKRSSLSETNDSNRLNETASTSYLMDIGELKDHTTLPATDKSAFSRTIRDRYGDNTSTDIDVSNGISFEFLM